jgi:hypothetical protein
MCAHFCNVLMRLNSRRSVSKGNPAFAVDSADDIFQQLGKDIASGERGQRTLLDVFLSSSSDQFFAVLIAQAAQHHHRDVGCGGIALQVFEDFRPAHLGQDHVQQNQVGLLGLSHLESGDTVFGTNYLIARFVQDSLVLVQEGFAIVN